MNIRRVSVVSVALIASSFAGWFITQKSDNLISDAFADRIDVLALSKDAKKDSVVGIHDVTIKQVKETDVRGDVFTVVRGEISNSLLAANGKVLARDINKGSVLTFRDFVVPASAESKVEVNQPEIVDEQDDFIKERDRVVQRVSELRARKDIIEFSESQVREIRAMGAKSVDIYRTKFRDEDNILEDETVRYYDVIVKGADVHNINFDNTFSTKIWWAEVPPIKAEQFKAISERIDIAKSSNLGKCELDAFKYVTGKIQTKSSNGSFVSQVKDQALGGKASSGPLVDASDLTAEQKDLMDRYKKANCNLDSVDVDEKIVIEPASGSKLVDLTKNLLCQSDRCIEFGLLNPNFDAQAAEEKSRRDYSFAEREIALEQLEAEVETTRAEAAQTRASVTPEEQRTSPEASEETED